jgi:LacI family transcriptional regulator
MHKKAEASMFTIKDIAKEAGVSVTTVSNVIHKNYSRVSKDTVEKILDIIETNKYVPSMSARSLVNNSSRIIGVINHLIPSKGGSFLQDPFHTASIGGIEESLSKNGYFMMVRTVNSENDLISLLTNWNLDGLIFVGLFKDAFFNMLMTLNVPVLLIDSYIEDERVLSVGLEDRKGGYIATKHLIEKGHRDILFVSPKIKVGGVLDERLKGYKLALKEANIKFEKKNVCEHNMGTNESIELGRELSSRRDMTAIFATADLMAAGIISGLNDNGVRVPEDVSVVGFDDLSISRLTRPRITTIHQDAEEKGKIAADMMIDCLKGRPAADRKIILPVNLIERDSVRDIHR